jgi:uncharacterized glyoxalase superfamily protein PhnB
MPPVPRGSPERIAIRPPDTLEGAVHFYEQLFDMESERVQGPGWVEMTLGPVRLRVERVSPDDPADGPVPGAPILELVVDDVTEWTLRAQQLGGVVRVRLREGKQCKTDVEPANYAQIIDPFGYRWAFAAPPT